MDKATVNDNARRQPHVGAGVWMAVALAWLAVALLAMLLPGLGRQWHAQRAYPFQLDAEEGFIYGQALTLASGGSLYPPIARPPFVVGNYTPLFPAVYSLLCPSPSPLGLPRGRMLVELSVLAVAIGIGSILWRRTSALAPAARAPLTLLGPLLFLVSYETYHWSAFVRVDFPALGLTIAGLAAFLLVQARWGAALAAALFVAAVYTRQTAILAPLACGAALLWHDRRRLFVWYLPVLLGGGLAVLAWLEWRTGGEFLRHTVLYNQNQMDWTGWRRLMKNELWFFDRWWVLALVALGAARVLGRRYVPASAGEPPHARHALGLYAILAGASLLSYAKVGAAPNYVLEPLAGAALWSADILGRLWMGWIAMRSGDGASGHSRWLDRAAWGIVLLAGLLLAAHAGRLWRLSHLFPWSPVPQVADRAAAGAVLAEARRAPGDIFSEEPVYTLLAGKPVLFQPFIMSQLAREGRWNEQPLLAMLRERRFSLLIVTEDLAQPTASSFGYERYTPAMGAAIRAAYVPAGWVALPTLGKRYFLWRPASGPSRP